MGWRTGAAVLLMTIAIASLALNVYQYLSVRASNCHLTSVETRFQSTQSAFNYGVANVTIPMPPPQVQSIPNFIVGNYLFKATSVGPPCPYSSHNGVVTMATCVQVTFTVTTTHDTDRESDSKLHLGRDIQREWSYSPINATLFGGSVRMGWSADPSLPYLHITTKWPPIA
jgi:hypothetical protein